MVTEKSTPSPSTYRVDVVRSDQAARRFTLCTVRPSRNSMTRSSSTQLCADRAARVVEQVKRRSALRPEPGAVDH
jgi:hypothetical protein